MPFSPYVNNITTKPTPSVVGFKTSKPGFDANRSAGSNMVFDSSWPSLPIAFETNITNPITGTGSTATIAHNLGFPPFCMGWWQGLDNAALGPLDNVSSRFSLMCDSTNIYMDGNTAASPPFTAVKLMIRAFQLDLSKDVEYNLAPGDSFNMPYDPNFGFKFVKQYKDINSTDMRDFIVHSRCQSPLILAVKTEATIPTANLGTAIGNVIQYQTSLSYPAWIYGFIKRSTGKYLPAPYYQQAYPRTFTDGQTSYIGYTGTDIGATLVVLRDPMFASTQTTVVF